MFKSGQRFQDIDDRTEELRDRTTQHPDIWQVFLKQFELSWIYHENALEGVVVTHAEMVSALKGRPIAPDTYHAIRNQKLATHEMRRMAAEGGPITLERVLKLHSTLGSGEPDFEPGKHRKIIPLHRTYFHEIAQPQAIQPRMDDLLAWAQTNDPGDEDAVKFAAAFHHEFMSIFPYPTQTGKVGRLLINYILLRHGYMPVILHGAERQRYYDTLRQNSKKMEQFLHEMMMNCIDNAQKYFEHELEEREKARVRALHVAS